MRLNHQPRRRSARHHRARPPRQGLHPGPVRPAPRAPAAHGGVLGRRGLLVQPGLGIHKGPTRPPWPAWCGSPTCPRPGRGPGRRRPATASPTTPAAPASPSPSTRSRHHPAAAGHHHDPRVGSFFYENLGGIQARPLAGGHREYLLPVPLGSPENSFGNDPDLPAASAPGLGATSTARRPTTSRVTSSPRVQELDNSAPRATTRTTGPRGTCTPSTCPPACPTWR